MGVGSEGEETETRSLTADDGLMNTEYRRLLSFWWQTVFCIKAKSIQKKRCPLIVICHSEFFRTQLLMNAGNATLISEYFGRVIFGIMFDCSSQVTLQFKCFSATWDSPKHLQIHESIYEVTAVVVSITCRVSLLQNIPACILPEYQIFIDITKFYSPEWDICIDFFSILSVQLCSNFSF